MLLGLKTSEKKKKNNNKSNTTRNCKQLCKIQLNNIIYKKTNVLFFLKTKYCFGWNDDDINNSINKGSKINVHIVDYEETIS